MLERLPRLQIHVGALPLGHRSPGVWLMRFGQERISDRRRNQAESGSLQEFTSVEHAHLKILRESEVCLNLNTFPYDRHLGTMRV